MQKEYLLDTNAFFNLLSALNPDAQAGDSLPEPIEKLLSEKLCVSTITKVEIISVLGKYARGNQGGLQKCTCKISQTGDLCQNNRYSEPRPKWNKRKIKAWLQFISEIFEGRSRLLSLGVEPFNQETISEAERIILHALSNNFASMDAMIAATARIAKDDKRDVTVITSDKGLKACLGKCDIQCWDLFAQIAQIA